MARYYRSNYNRARFSSSVSDGFCTERQHDLILSLVAEAEQAEDKVDPDRLAVIGSLIDAIDTLPALLSSDWRTVPVREASKAIDGLKAVQSLIRTAPGVVAAAEAARAAERAATPGIPASASRVIPAKVPNKTCTVCGTGIVVGQDYAASIGGSWVNYCRTCASTDPAEAQARADAEYQARLSEALRHPGLHLAEGKVWRVDDKGVHARRYGAQFRRVRSFPALSADTLLTGDRATAYAAEHGCCIACAESIGHGTERRSLAVGYGPVCAKRYGWYYPTKDEAEAILARHAR